MMLKAIERQMVLFITEDLTYSYVALQDTFYKKRKVRRVVIQFYMDVFKSMEAHGDMNIGTFQLINNHVVKAI